ncbi:MAG: hypothetical protein ACFE89_12135 [Candidatus Hodarchaeota archaeon]
MPEVRVVVSTELDRFMDTVVQKGMFSSKAELIRAALIRYFETLPIRMPSGYDDTTLFSPDGRIFQIEYAMESPPRGVTIVGLRYDKGVILAKERVREAANDDLSFVVHHPWENYRVVNHIGMVPTGLSGDFNLLKNHAISLANAFKAETKAPIFVEELANQLALFIHSYTTKKESRPLGIVTLLGGVDDTGSHLFVLDPSGTYREVLAWAEGQHRKAAKELLKVGVKPDLPFKQALALVVKSLLRDKTRKPGEVNVTVIDEQTKTQRQLTESEIQAIWSVAFS